METRSRRRLRLRRRVPPLILTLRNSEHAFFLLLLLLQASSPSSHAQFTEADAPPPYPAPVDPFAQVRFGKSMAVLFVVLVVVFFALGFLSVYSRQCAERRLRSNHDLAIPIGSNNHHRPRGLDPQIIHAFPTFVYSTVKSLQIGRSTALECAVCLNEFEDHETLRFIPKCSHVFHPHCIDLWLSSHSTCPVCRANLSPAAVGDGDGDASFIAVHLPESDLQPDSEEQHNRDRNSDMIVQIEPENVTPSTIGDSSSPKNRADLANQNRPARSRSTGFRIASLFPRSHSTGHSLLVSPPGDQNPERFTLRLPEEVRRELMKSSTLNRTKSLTAFRRMSSERRGYRTRSVGLTWTPPFIGRSRSTKGWPERSRSRKQPPVETSEEDVGERSSDRLVPHGRDN